jgi:catechol 2,3-dioxygenase-like lactoylglutathione lyase family enzyme
MLDDARIFHVNVNCSDLAASRTFYVDHCGLTEGVRTTPDGVQSGTAFGLDRARWDAWILVGADAFEGGAVDLLEWQDPRPAGAATTPGARGFTGVRIAVGDGGAGATALDPDGVSVELVPGPVAGLTAVVLGCADRERSLAFYRALGFRDEATDPTRADEVVLVPSGAGPVRLVLARAGTPTTSDAAARPANTVGIWRAALLLGDLDAAVERLRRAGIALLSDPQEMAMGPGIPDLRFVCFRGPDQEVIELIESPGDGPGG